MRNIINRCKGGVIRKMPTDILNIITRIKLWPISLKALIICMMIDYITGIIVAGVFKKVRRVKMESLNQEQGLKDCVEKAQFCL